MSIHRKPLTKNQVFRQSGVIVASALVGGAGLSAGSAQAISLTYRTYDTNGNLLAPITLNADPTSMDYSFNILIRDKEGDTARAKGSIVALAGDSLLSGQNGSTLDGAFLHLFDFTLTPETKGASTKTNNLFDFQEFNFFEVTHTFNEASGQPFAYDGMTVGRFFLDGDLFGSPIAANTTPKLLADMDITAVTQPNEKLAVTGLKPSLPSVLGSVVPFAAPGTSSLELPSFVDPKFRILFKGVNLTFNERIELKDSACAVGAKFAPGTDIDEAESQYRIKNAREDCKKMPPDEVSVPESSSVLGLLALALMGTGALITQRSRSTSTDLLK